MFYLTMLSNEMIITSSIYTIRIYKKGENSSYQIYQIFKIADWNEIYKIKELENSNFQFVVDMVLLFLIRIIMNMKLVWKLMNLHLENIIEYMIS